MNNNGKSKCYEKLENIREEDNLYHYNEFDANIMENVLNSLLKEERINIKLEKHTELTDMNWEVKRILQLHLKPKIVWFSNQLRIYQYYGKVKKQNCCLNIVKNVCIQICCWGVGK